MMMVRGSLLVISVAIGSPALVAAAEVTVPNEMSVSVTSVLGGSGRRLANGSRVAVGRLCVPHSPTCCGGTSYVWVKTKCAANPFQEIVFGHHLHDSPTGLAFSD